MNQTKTIVVLDTDSASAMMLTEALTDVGYKVYYQTKTCLSNEMIECFQPHLLIADLRPMNADTTLLMLDRLRRSPSTYDMPVLVCSTDSRLLHYLEAPLRHFGCSTLTKPCELDELYDSVSRMFAHSERAVGGCASLS